MPQAFCAGGDVKEVVLRARSGDWSYGCEFFRVEYANNAAIAQLPMPYVAVMDGIVMGGGVGVSYHGTFRVATERYGEVDERAARAAGRAVGLADRGIASVAGRVRVPPRPERASPGRASFPWSSAGRHLTVFRTWPPSTRCSSPVARRSGMSSRDSVEVPYHRQPP